MYKLIYMSIYYWSWRTSLQTHLKWNIHCRLLRTYRLLKRISLSSQRLCLVLSFLLILSHILIALYFTFSFGLRNLILFKAQQSLSLCSASRQNQHWSVMQRSSPLIESIRKSGGSTISFMDDEYSDSLMVSSSARAFLGICCCSSSLETECSCSLLRTAAIT